MTTSTQRPARKRIEGPVYFRRIGGRIIPFKGVDPRKQHGARVAVRKPGAAPGIVQVAPKGIQGLRIVAGQFKAKQNVPESKAAQIGKSIATAKKVIAATGRPFVPVSQRIVTSAKGPEITAKGPIPANRMHQVSEITMSGNTYQHRERLASMGATYNSKSKTWHVSGSKIHPAIHNQMAADLQAMHKTGVQIRSTMNPTVEKSKYMYSTKQRYVAKAMPKTLKQQVMETRKAKGTPVARMQAIKVKLRTEIAKQESAISANPLVKGVRKDREAFASAIKKLKKLQSQMSRLNRAGARMREKVKSYNVRTGGYYTGD